jgi:hypothetical protein
MLSSEGVPPDHEPDRPTATLVIYIDSDEITKNSPR